MSNWKFFLLKNNTEADYNGDVTVTGWKLILGDYHYIRNDRCFYPLLQTHCNAKQGLSAN